MYIDMLSPAAYGRFNRKLANLTSLTCACYFSEILDIIARVLKKNKYDELGFFVLDRNYIRKQLNLTVEQQVECDTILAKLCILEVHAEDKNKMRVNLENFASILADSDVKALKKVSVAVKATKEEKAEGKRIGIISRLQSKVEEADQDLKQAYCGFIEANYGRITAWAQVQVFIDALNNYTADKETKLAVIKIATTNQYRECQWAIDRYEREHKKQPIMKQNIVEKISDFEF